MDKDKKKPLYTKYNIPDDCKGKGNKHTRKTINGVPLFELWSLSYYLAEHILIRLKAFRKANPVGWAIGPYAVKIRDFDYSPSTRKKSEKQKDRVRKNRKLHTDKLLDEMILAFECIVNGPPEEICKLSVKEQHAFDKSVKRGLTNFVKYLEHLWW